MLATASTITTTTTTITTKATETLSPTMQARIIATLVAQCCTGNMDYRNEVQIPVDSSGNYILNHLYSQSSSGIIGTIFIHPMHDLYFQILATL